MKIAKWTFTINVITWTKISFLLGSSLLPSAHSGPTAQFLNGMPDGMNMTEDINLVVENLPNPSEGHILPGISQQEAIEVNVWQYIHYRHC
jgi:hypothetical protein